MVYLDETSDRFARKNFAWSSVFIWCHNIVWLERLVTKTLAAALSLIYRYTRTLTYTYFHTDAITVGSHTQPRYFIGPLITV